MLVGSTEGTEKELYLKYAEVVKSTNEEILDDIFNAKEGRKEYQRESDGHTYYYDFEGELVGAPTCLDDSVEYENCTYVSEFAYPLTEVEIADIKEKLR